MTVTGGARVETPTGAVGSFAAGSVGTVVLDGADASGNPSSWLIAELNIGLNATSQGTLRIRNGALFRTTSTAYGLNVGTPGTASVFVEGTSGSGNPSLLDVEILTIGSGPYGNGTGDVTASGGGRIQTGNVFLAPTGGMATLTITDADSALVQSGASTIIVGHATNGTAAVNIRNNAHFTTGTGAITVNATGQINLESGAVFDARGPINMNGGQFNFLGGTLHIDAFNGNLVNQGGTLAPGHSAGTTAVSGNYTQRSAARLEVEVGGVLPGQWDMLTVEGNAILEGTLEVKLIDGFEPVMGNSFTILTTNVGNVGGQFDTELFPIFNDLTFDVIYNPKSVVLAVIEAPLLPGDYNQNGVVDAADFVLWRNTLGQMGMGLAADGNGSGTIDFGDYDVWRADFGQAAGSGAGTYFATGISSDASSAIPEPTSQVLIATVLIALACIRSRFETCREE
jgi:hypothetical protein